jgi:hypothetical protein
MVKVGGVAIIPQKESNMSFLAGTVNSHREHERDDPDALPREYRQNTAVLYAAAAKRGLYVIRLGGERFQVADTRGHIMLRDGSFDDALGVCRHER